MAVAKFGSGRWMTWRELCEYDEDKGAKPRPDTWLTIRQGQGDWLASRVRPNAEDEPWWGSGNTQAWWPGLEFLLVGSDIVAVREAEPVRFVWESRWGLASG